MEYEDEMTSKMTASYGASDLLGCERIDGTSF